MGLQFHCCVSFQRGHRGQCHSGTEEEGTSVKATHRQGFWPTLLGCKNGLPEEMPSLEVPMDMGPYCRPLEDDF